jgi:hypothetical protein
MRYVCEAFVAEAREQVDDNLEVRPHCAEVAPANWAIWRGQELIGVEPTAGLAAIRLEWWLCNEAIRRNGHLLQVHAGAAAKGEAAIFFPAVSGTGKSTLTLALLARDFALLSDDIAFLDLATGLALPFWRSFHFDATSIIMLRRLHVGCTAFPTERTFPPSTFGLHAQPVAAPLRFLVFPERDGLAPGQLQPLSHSEAMAMTIPHAPRLRNGDRVALDGFQRLVAECACYRLGSSDLSAAIDALDTLVSAS